MNRRSAKLVDFIALPASMRWPGLYVLWLGNMISAGHGYDDRPIVSVPQPLTPGEVSPDFHLGDPLYTAWRDASYDTAEPQPRWQQPTAAPPEDWRQPAVQPLPPYPPAISPASYPEELVEPEWEVPSYGTAQHPTGMRARQAKPAQREGFFQRFTLRETYLPDGSISDFGMLSTDLAVTVAIPFPSREMPLILTPAFGLHLLDGPSGVDLPNRLYDNSLKFQTMFKINDRWGANIAVTPGWYSDFETGNDEALRITGHAFAAWDQNPHVQWIFGVVYLDWQSIRLLPAAGVIIKPDVDTRIELTFPRPRYAQRIGCTLFGDVWWYAAGELGGGTWAIETTGGGNDVVTISDYRFVLGIENQGSQGLKTYFEVGYVFGREIEFESATPDYDPGDTLLLRYGLSY